MRDKGGGQSGKDAQKEGPGTREAAGNSWKEWKGSTVDSFLLLTFLVEFS